MIDLESFLGTHRADHLHIEKPVPLDHIPALTAEAGQTIVFENIDGYPDWRLVDQLFVDRAAQGRVLGCAPSDVVPELAAVLKRGPRPLVEVEGGPCQEVVIEGDDVDLAMLPVVTHTDRDPYPYTTSFAIHRDPETGQYNQMFPRCGVMGRREMVASFVTSTANRILGKYRAAGEKMPQAVAIGTHPAWELAGCYSHPHDDWWEMELFESITGSPGEVTRCRTVDLVVPADASVVIEGYVDPERLAPDGPSPGPSMMFIPYVTQQPVFVVTAITHRRRPIYRNHQVTPFTDHQEMPRLFHEAIIYEKLRAMNIGVRDVHFPQGGGSLTCIIQVEPSADGQVNDALLSVMGSTWANTKMVVAVDPDIDIYDYRDVQYALSVRVDPSRDVIIVPNTRGHPYDPTARPVVDARADTAQTRVPAIGGRWGIDATKPVPYRVERSDYERAWPRGWGEVSLADYVDR
jgi:2,5-furandicarboxylate decarboxylase 1